MFVLMLIFIILFLCAMHDTYKMFCEMVQLLREIASNIKKDEDHDSPLD